MSKKKLGVLISGGGTNMQAIVDSCREGILKDVAEVVLVVSNIPDANGLGRAKKLGIETICIERKNYKDNKERCNAMADALKKKGVVLVCLAGFLAKLEPEFIAAFGGKVINIHPALLPKYGGKGMYGHHVHEAVIAHFDKESGATVHWVDGQYDHGEIILQETVQIVPFDTADTLAMKVLEVEHRLYPKAIKKILTSI
jgi:phosphoribosylglycinamide formyltransferase-1